MNKMIWLILIGVIIYQYFGGSESGCAKYNSKYSCDYVESEASFDVYYWARLEKNDTDDNKYIGTVIGLKTCKSVALRYSESINETWNNRSYICVLYKDGDIEKHRF